MQTSQLLIRIQTITLMAKMENRNLLTKLQAERDRSLRNAIAAQRADQIRVWDEAARALMALGRKQTEEDAYREWALMKDYERGANIALATHADLMKRNDFEGVMVSIQDTVNKLTIAKENSKALQNKYDAGLVQVLKDSELAVAILLNQSRAVALAQEKEIAETKLVGHPKYLRRSHCTYEIDQNVQDENDASTTLRMPTP